MRSKKGLIIFLCLTLAVAALVMYMGSRGANQSYGQSSWVLSWFTKLVPFFGKLPQGRQVYLIRRMAHAFEYGIFALCCSALLFSIGKIEKKWACGAVTMLATFGLACIDELLIQAGTAGRTGTFKDVLFDCASALVVAIIVMIVKYKHDGKNQ